MSANKTPKKPAEEAPEEAGKVRVRALKTPVSVPGATLARGGMATIDLKTAEMKAASGELTIIQRL